MKRELCEVCDWPESANGWTHPADATLYSVSSDGTIAEREIAAHGFVPSGNFA